MEATNYRDKISTVDQDGKRVWVYPKKPHGKFYDYRKWVSYLLLGFLFAAPHIRINGKQLLLFNILDRKFILFGKVFWPQDLWIFALALIAGIVFIILFTIIFGRLFCGWMCPQTIFMEMVFRRIEYWIEGDASHQKRLKKQPWNREKMLKKGSKYVIFWIISFLIANTFLAYIIGSKALWEIQMDPLSTHLGGFLAILIFTTVFFFVFAHLREQVCTTICPYGRLQGVLLDQNSMVVAYDYKRGEGRGKFKKGEDRSKVGKGDCIDCHQCVDVCPTGIDIRNGTQLECVNCTACIDACDHMMEAVDLKKGLIRFVSENGIKNRTPFQWTARVKSYTLLLVFLVGAVVTAVITRRDFDSTIIRMRGTTHKITKGKIQNFFELSVLNKRDETYQLELRIEGGGDARIIPINKDMTLKPESQLKSRFILELPMLKMKGSQMVFYTEVLGNGEVIERVKTKFIGPIL
ncbi:MAG: cytochrome c oxidase accessory protein CcoG [Crocinitomicaceae bacterium]|jgi:cytochrome c oxidase accessory protein FixG|nr:cytochrome c oxidase accessory protein CcoG [Crocinitomicaceae bacterium]